MDYKKYCYDMTRRIKDIRKNQKIVVVKEIRLSPVVGDNDFAVKVKNCLEFLEAGHKVKVNLFYPKGKKRLLQLDSSSKILDKFVEALGENAIVEGTTVVDGRTTAIQVGPKKNKK